MPRILKVPIIAMMSSVLSPAGLISRSHTSSSTFKQIKSITCTMQETLKSEIE